MAQIPAGLQDLVSAATQARENSYSPYSRYKVGAAIRTSDGRIYSGCNMENSSFGATICAERAAICSAVSQQGKLKITEVLVVTDATPPWPPCGMCRQVIAEFAAPDAKLHAVNLQGVLVSNSFQEIFPNAFTPAHLQDA